MANLNDLPGYLIRRMHQISVSVFTAGLSEAGFNVTPVQYATLNVIGERPGIDQATLAGLIAQDAVTIGGVIERLNQRGLVIRSVSTTDRRARRLDLTDAGRAALLQIEPHVRAAQHQMLSGLNDAEQETLVRLLRKAADSANQQSRAPLREHLRERGGLG